jgi:hypothetical protein
VNQVSHTYGAKELPVLQANHPLAKLYMRKAHEKGHEGQSRPFTGPKEMWIVNSLSLVETIRTSCTECRLKGKRCMSQRMGPLPNHRVGPCPIFQ